MKNRKVISTREAVFDKKVKHYMNFPVEFKKVEQKTETNKKAKTSKKAITDGKGHFTAYANVFTPDRINDITDANTFKKTLKERKGLVPIYFMHNPNKAMGLGLLKVDEKGLFVTEDSFIDLDTQLGKEVYSGMIKEYITELSIGYYIIKAHWETVKEDGKEIEYFKLDEIKLDEFSMLPMYLACHPDAKVEEIKSMDFEKVIKEFGESIKNLENKIEELEKKVIAQKPSKDTSDETEPGDHSEKMEKESITAIMESIKEGRKLIEGE